jgi:hypothetical protein
VHQFATKQVIFQPSCLLCTQVLNSLMSPVVVMSSVHIILHVLQVTHAVPVPCAICSFRTCPGWSAVSLWLRVTSRSRDIYMTSLSCAVHNVKRGTKREAEEVQSFLHHICSQPKRISGQVAACHVAPHVVASFCSSTFTSQNCRSHALRLVRIGFAREYGPFLPVFV